MGIFYFNLFYNKIPTKNEIESQNILTWIHVPLTSLQTYKNQKYLPI